MDTQIFRIQDKFLLICLMAPSEKSDYMIHRRRFQSPCIGTAIEHFFGKVNLVEPELEGDVSAAPFGDGCKMGIRGVKNC